MKGDGKRGLRLDSAAMRIVAPAAFAVVVLAVWQLYTVVSDVPESSLPAPTEIARAGWEHRDLLIDNTWVTVEEILIGFALASRLPVWASVAVVLALEAAAAIAIRDNLALNVLMLVWPVEAVRVWQSGG